jgi:7-cyano-7-deazaguanine synthase in queuosine biosynthesis
VASSTDFSKRHTLLMLSGGIDSLYALHQVLTRTDDVLWVHHVNLVNREGRHQAEARACAGIVAWCAEHLRPFRYTESTIDHGAFELFGRDVLLVAFEAGIVAQNAHALWQRGFDRWLLGYCQEEAQEVVGGVAVASTNRRSVIETCLATSAAPLVPPRLDSQALISKRAQIEALPVELARLAWTCRRPVWRDGVASECGTCKTCKLMAPIRGELAQAGYALEAPSLGVERDLTVHHEV